MLEAESPAETPVPPETSQEETNSAPAPEVKPEPIDPNRIYTLEDLNVEAKQIIVDGCTKYQRKIEDLQPDFFASVCSLSADDQKFAANRFFMSELGAHLQLHCAHVLKSYRSIKESYKARVGDWLCNKCGLWNFASRPSCNFQGCRSARAPNAIVMSYDPTTKKQKPLESCKRFQKGDCNLGDKCRYSHGASTNFSVKGFESLPQEVQDKFNLCFQKNGLKSTDIDACVYNSFNDFASDIQLQMIANFCLNKDIPSIRNKSGYLIGILKKYREHGKALTGLKPASGRPRSRSPRRSSRRYSPDRYERDRRDYDDRAYYRSRSRGRRSLSRHRDERYDRLSPRRLSPRRLSPRRLSPRRLSPRRLSPRRLSPLRASPPRIHYDRRSRSPLRYRDDPRYDVRRSPPRRELSPRDGRGLSPRSASLRVSAHLSPSRNGRASPRRDVTVRGVGRPLSPPPMAGPPPALDVKWYWTDATRGERNGPTSLVELRNAWIQGITNGGCLAWCATMQGWEEIRTLPALFAYLQSR